MIVQDFIIAVLVTLLGASWVLFLLLWSWNHKPAPKTKWGEGQYLSKHWRN